MRDLTLFAMLVGFCALALSRAWFGVVALALVGAMHPQAYSDGWMARFPFYKVLFLATCAGVAVDCWRTRRWPTFPWDWRDWGNWPLFVLGLLFVDFAITTQLALLPDTARGRLFQVAMLLPPLLLALWLIDTREKLRFLIIATAAGIALVALKGGYWALLTGFADRVYGPPGSQIGDNNGFAVALAMTIPLVVLWWRQTTDRGLRWALLGMIALCYVAVLTSWSRGGVASLAAMSVFLVWHSRRKTLAVLLVAIGVAAVLVTMPEGWLARMESVSSHGSDASFQGRVEAWRQGLAYFRQDPWTGSGFDGWRALTAKFVSGNDPPAVIAWHSAYVEILAEHGFPGFLLWATLLLGTLIELTRMIGRGRREADAWAADHGAMLRAALVAYVVGGLTLSMAYWELLYQILACAWIALCLARGNSGVRAGLARGAQ